jgi:FkbM family methyltransferase
MSIFSRKYHQAKRLFKQFFGFSNNQEKLIIPTDEHFQHKPLKYYQTPIGNYYLPADATNDCIANDMRSGKIFEQEIIDVASKYIRNDSIVLDIGANFGQMSLIFSQFVGEDGQVFSFEADDYIFYILQQNILANNCHNIRAFLRGVYDQTGDIMFYPVQDFKRFSAYGSYGIQPKATFGRKIETIAIDDLNFGKEISFMKVDVQGSDLFAMRGAIETIKGHKMPIIFEFEQQFQNEFNTSFQDYLDFIISISYKVEKVINGINYLIVPDTRKIISITADIPKKKNLKLKKISSYNTLCKFLQTRAEIDECTTYLYKNGFVSHSIQCKDWDLSHILPEIEDGNFLDIGSSDSYILKNLALKKIHGELYGIDLREPNIPVKGVKYITGNFMDTKLPKKYFRNISCLSVIEHEVDFTIFAKEVAHLLEDNGRLFVTFDYWDPKIIPNVKLYGLTWQPLDNISLLKFINECKANELYLIQDMDWTINEAVIRDGYYSPDPTVNYTFGIVVFEKR